MQIDKTINKWFDETTEILGQRGTPREDIDDILFASIAVVVNHLNSTLLLLNNKKILPARALLRVSSEFIAKLIYCCLQDKAVSKIRTDSWKKTSYIKTKKYLQNVKDGFEQKLSENIEYKHIYQQGICKIKQGIEEIENELDDFQKDKGLEQTTQILPSISLGGKHPFGEAGVYQQYLNAIHIDLETLAKTIKKGKTGTEYMGDVENNIEYLKFECLWQGYIFFKEICRYYKLDLLSQKIENEFIALTPKSYMKN